MRVARIAPHYWEEPCLAGENGSGAVFFSGCNLKCVYCQNNVIAHGKGTYISEDALAEKMLILQGMGCDNVNLITATHFIPSVVNTLIMAKKMGAERIIFHPASQGKEERSVAVARTIDRLKKLEEIIRGEGLDDLIYCPETMGKVVQIGDVKEVTEFCKISDLYVPTVDFGHLNAREQGTLKDESAFLEKMTYMIDNLGYDRVKNFHVHFSKIQYSAKGEIRHLNFDDTVYGPEFEPFIDACLKLNLEPEVICESSGNQAEDALSMMKYYLSKQFS